MTLHCRCVCQSALPPTGLDLDKRGESGHKQNEYADLKNMFRLIPVPQFTRVVVMVFVCRWNIRQVVRSFCTGVPVRQEGGARCMSAPLIIAVTSLCCQGMVEGACFVLGPTLLVAQVVEFSVLLALHFRQRMQLPIRLP